MKYDFFPIKIKFVKRENTNYDFNHYDTAKIGDTFNGIIDFEEKGGINSKYISLYSDCSKFCTGTSPATEGNNKHKTPYVYSFIYISFDESRYAKETIERANTEEKILDLAKAMLKKYGYYIELEKLEFKRIFI